MHTCIHPCMHACSDARIHTYVHTCMHAYMLLLRYLSMHKQIHTVIHNRACNHLASITQSLTVGERHAAHRLVLVRLTTSGLRFPFLTEVACLSKGAKRKPDFEQPPFHYKGPGTFNYQ